ncbi:MAG: globin [Acidimicrobiales bacterium]|nr:globin [Acidimicrobiales bacterium]
MTGTAEEQPLFERVDGEAFFVGLVDRFYTGVMADPVLAPLYPPDDVEGAKERLAGFLVQFWGGPTTYSDRRGHPRLRMRHAPFVIGPAQRDAWFRHMATAVGGAVEAGELSTDDEARMLAYFHRAAEHMVNQPPDPVPRA